MIDVTLITGATSGIGYELVKICATHHENMLLVARNTEKLEEMQKELMAQFSIQVYIFSGDLSFSSTPQAIYDFTVQQEMRVNCLINNAGFGDFGMFHETDLVKQNDMIALNITALTNMCHLFLQGMVEQQKGKIMNVASIAAFQPGPLMSVYYATKAYVLSFSEGLAEELNDTGVSVTVLCPGPTTTGFEASSNLDDSGLFKNMQPTTAKAVAVYGYKAMQQGKVVAVEGAKNKVVVQSSRFVPRSFVRKLTKNIQKKQ